MHKCLNCESALQGKFCSQCGQNSELKSLTLRTIFHAAFTNVFGIESKLLHTFIGLLKRPGVVCLEYISGKRKPYVNPVNLYLFSVALTLFTMQYFPIDWANEVSKQTASAQHISEMKHAEKIALQTVEFATEYYRYTDFLLYLSIPLFLRFFFRKLTFNLTEFIVFMLYTGSIIKFLMFPVNLLLHYKVIPFSNIFTLLPTLIFLTYSGFGFLQKRSFAVFFKLNLSFFLAMGLLVGILFTIGSILVLNKG